MNTSTDDMETLLLAERAAEWLVRLETDDPAVHDQFRRWVIASPLHVREALAASITHLVLKHLLGKRRMDPGASAA